MNISISSKRRMLAATAPLLATIVVATGCGSSSKAGGSPATGSDQMSSMPGSAGSTTATGDMTIDIKNFSFMPMSATVTVGTKVTWKFEDSAAHTVKADDGSFTSPALSNGQTFSHTFTKAGTYSYICSIHQYMHGTIVVK